MQRAFRNALGLLSLVCVITFPAIGWPTTAQEQPNITNDQRSIKSLSLPEARRQARLLHDVYSDMLDVIHRDYFREGGGRKVVPSRSLESVFRRQQSRTKIKARWLAVNANAMHVNHEPKDAFEKAAVRALASGKSSFESVSKGRYHRAAAIPLAESCLKCHLVLRSGKPRPRMAALVISMPVRSE